MELTINDRLIPLGSVQNRLVIYLWAAQHAIRKSLFIFQDFSPSSQRWWTRSQNACLTLNQSIILSSSLLSSLTGSGSTGSRAEVSDICQTSLSESLILLAGEIGNWTEGLLCAKQMIYHSYWWCHPHGYYWIVLLKSVSSTLQHLSWWRRAWHSI